MVSQREVMAPLAGWIEEEQSIVERKRVLIPFAQRRFRLRRIFVSIRVLIVLVGAKRPGCEAWRVRPQGPRSQ